ncbi:MAG: endonuclease III [Candidatus Pacearchaeota archaeon]
MNSLKAVKQLNKIKSILRRKPRLAAEGWKDDWKTLIAIILSARTRDSVTIKVCEELFKKYKNARDLAEAKIEEIEKIIKPINFYKTKAKKIILASEKIVKEGFPKNFEELLRLPGVGRKTANVFLAERRNASAIGVDTHVARISKKLGWTKNTKPEKIEEDLQKLFPKSYWRSINYILVSFGQTVGRNRKEEDKVLKKIKSLK